MYTVLSFVGIGTAVYSFSIRGTTFLLKLTFMFPNKSFMVLKSSTITNHAALDASFDTMVRAVAVPD